MVYVRAGIYASFSVCEYVVQATALNGPEMEFVTGVNLP